MTDNPETPMLVNPAATPVIANTVLRDIAIVVAAYPILTKLIGAGDINGILHFLQSSQGATVLAVVVPVLLTAWRSRRALWIKAQTVFLAHRVSDRVAIVTAPTPPPAV